MNATSKGSKRRFMARYVMASLTIPVGVALGVGGLVQNWSRGVRGFERRTTPERAPDGFDEPVTE